MSQWNKILISGSDAQLKSIFVDNTAKIKGATHALSISASSFISASTLDVDGRTIIGQLTSSDTHIGGDVHVGFAPGGSPLLSVHDGSNNDAKFIVVDNLTGKLHLTASGGGGGITNTDITEQVTPTVTISDANNESHYFVIPFAQQIGDSQTLKAENYSLLSEGLVYNPFLNVLSVGGGAGSIYGVVSNASNANNVTLTEENDFEDSRYITFTGGDILGSVEGDVTANNALRIDSSLKYTPSTDTIDAIIEKSKKIKISTQNISNIDLVDLNGGEGIDLIIPLTLAQNNSDIYPAEGTSQFQNLVANEKLKFNPSTGTLTSTNFTGNGSGISNVAATSAITANTANTANSATTAAFTNEVNIYDINNKDDKFLIPFVDSKTTQQSETQQGLIGSKTLNIDSNDLKYNPFTNTLTTDRFEGNLIGNAQTAGTATLATTATNADKIDINPTDGNASDYRLTMVNGGDNGENNNYNQLYSENSLIWNKTNKRLGIETSNNLGMMISTTSTSGYNSNITQTDNGLEIFNDSTAARDIIIGNKVGTDSSKKDSLTVKSNGNLHAPYLDSGGGNFIMLYDSATGEMSYQASTRKVKKNIKPAKKSLYNDVLKLTPSTFNRKNPKSPNLELGLIAEEAAEVNPLFALYGKNFKYNRTGSITTESGSKVTQDDSIVPVNVNWNAIVTSLIGKIQSLEQRVSDLEK